MKQKKRTRSGKSDILTLNKIADMIAKGEAPNTYIPAWTEYISGLEISDETFTVDQLVLYVELKSTQYFLKSILMRIQQKIEVANEDKRYFLEKIQELNEMGESICEYMEYLSEKTDELEQQIMEEYESSRQTTEEFLENFMRKQSPHDRLQGYDEERILVGEMLSNLKSLQSTALTVTRQRKLPRR